jgi:RNA polymerase sigma-70 factor (ECF subfamily)
LERAKKGNDDAFEILIRRSYHGCMRIAVSILGDSDEAADVVQHAFWRAYVHLSKFEGQARFSTWVGRIVINRCLTRLHSGKRWQPVPFETATESAANAAAHKVRQGADRDNPERLLSRKEMQLLVRKEVRQIPVLLRQPLEYHHLHGLPLEQVAGRLGISVSAAKSRLNRAHKYLRQRMTRHCGAHGPKALLDAA